MLTGSYGCSPPLRHHYSLSLRAPYINESQMVAEIGKPFTGSSDLPVKLWMLWKEHKFKVAGNLLALIGFN